MAKPVRIFMSLFEPTNDKRWEAEPQQIEEMLWKMAVLHLVLYITIKTEDVSGFQESLLIY